MFIGLDPSTHFGFAAVDVYLKSPVVLGTDVIEAPGRGIERALALTDQIIERIGAYENVDMIVVEGYSFASTQRLVDLVEIGTILRYQLMKTGLPFKLCPPSSLKKFVTGKGNSDKKRVILDAHKKWKFDLHDDNECDAACLAMMGMAYHSKGPFTAAQFAEATKLLSCN